MNTSLALRIAFSDDYLQVQAADGGAPSEPAYDLVRAALRDAAEEFGGSAYASDGDSFLLDCGDVQGALQAIVVRLTRAGYPLRVSAIDFCPAPPKTSTEQDHAGCPRCGGTYWVERTPPGGPG